MTAFLKALGYVGQSGLNKTISSRMGSERFYHPEVPGHSILVYRDKKTGKNKFMSTPADDHPKYKDGQTQVFNTDFEAVRHGAGHMMEKVPLKTAFKEAFTKKYRRKPVHRKIYRKKSYLRMGDGLVSFKDFMKESHPSTHTDLAGQKCRSCAGKYQETTVNDDKDGVLHCNKCGDETSRHVAFDDLDSWHAAGKKEQRNARRRVK